MLSTEQYDAWLIHWPTGTGLDAHDHGGSIGAFAVVSGVLDEDVHVDGVDHTRRLRAGESVTFAGDHVHAVINRGETGATSVHVYSPPLRSMSFYSGSPASGRTVDRVRAVRRPGRRHRMSAATDRLSRRRASTHQFGRSRRGGAVAGGGATFVDTRPAAQRAEFGEIVGAVVIERNVLEWRLDPTGEHRLESIDHDRPIVVFCQEGYSSSLAVASLVDLGLADVHDLSGGFAAWSAAGFPTEKKETP